MNDKYVVSKVDLMWGKLCSYQKRLAHYNAILAKIEANQEAIKTAGSPHVTRFDQEPVQGGTRNDPLANAVFKSVDLEAERSLAFCKLKEVETLIDLMVDEPIRSIATEKFIQGKSWETLEEERNMSRGAMVYNIKKQLAELIIH